MTADEIKQLHYKTIAFSTIGYPVIRDTVLFNKFICYKSGKVDIIPHKLSNQCDNYFVVEDIFKKQEIVSEQEKEQFQNDKIIYDREILQNAINIIKSIIKKN